MAEPTPANDTPAPTIKQGSGPDQLPWGEAAQVNELVGLVPPPEDPQDQYNPTTPEEQFVYGQTDRPTEPFSAGLPFGEGPNAVKGAQESDDQFVQRIAAEVKRDPTAPRQLKQFADRALNGL